MSLNKSVTKAALFSAQLLATFSQGEHFFGVQSVLLLNNGEGI